MRSAIVVSVRILAAWLVCSVAIIAVPLVLTDPATRSAYIYHRIIWTEVLSLIFWGSCIWAPLQMSSARIKKAAVWGTAPFIIIMSAIYGVLSFIMMISFAFHETEKISRYHIAGQIILGAVFLIMLLMLSIIPACSPEKQDEFDPKD